MKRFLKIIMFLPLVNFLSFFLLAIPFVIIYRISWGSHAKNFILVALGCIITAVMRFFSELVTGVLSQLLFWGSFYILGIYITVVALYAIPKRKTKTK